LAQAAHRTPPGSFALCESEATATMFFLRESEASAANVLSVRKCNDSNNVFSARKRSVSGKCFICAKAKRQQQMFFLRESATTATNVLSVRKRSDSNKKSAQSEQNQPHVLVMSSLSSKRIVNISALLRRGRTSAKGEQITSKTGEST